MPKTKRMKNKSNHNLSKEISVKLTNLSSFKYKGKNKSPEKNYSSYNLENLLINVKITENKNNIIEKGKEIIENINEKKEEKKEEAKEEQKEEQKEENKKEDKKEEKKEEVKEEKKEQIKEEKKEEEKKKKLKKKQKN